jgi:hypothetical protein
MHINKSENMSDPCARIRKSGFVAIHERMDKIKPIEMWLSDNLPLPATYDVVSGQPEYFSEFTYTEICGGMYLKPQSNKMAWDQIQDAIDDNNIDVDHVGILLQKISEDGGRDKYKLSRFYKGPDIDVLIILPGSNIINTTVDKQKISDVVERSLREGKVVKIKPHPITSSPIIQELKLAFGDDVILNKKISGFSALSVASNVYTLGASEMALYTIMMGKKLFDITHPEYNQRKKPLTYASLFYSILGKNQDDAKVVLNKIFNSAKSGIVFPWEDHQDKLQRYLEYIMAKRETYA